jgi:hypothetical protein
LFWQSKQTFLELFVKYVFPQTVQVHFRSKSLLPSPLGKPEFDAKKDGKTMAFLGHKGAHAVQCNISLPPPHLLGKETIAFSSLKVKTPFGQKSMHRGLPVLVQPSHLSE